jgi:type IV pilus assembly protein PilY1
VVSVDEANRTQSGDDLYMAFFKPMADTYWQGNLKKYGLALITRSDCGRTEPEWTVVDKNGNVAGLCDGTFKPNSISFWSNTNDGGHVDRGGVGDLLKEAMPGPDPIQVPGSGPYYDFRKIKTHKYGTMVDITRDNITNTDLDVATDLERHKIINYVYGYTFDADEAIDTFGNPVAKREWILGDIIHSEPRIIDYLDENDNLERRYIAVGSNDGMLHIFTDREIATLQSVRRCQRPYPHGRWIGKSFRIQEL